MILVLCAKSWIHQLTTDRSKEEFDEVRPMRSRLCKMTPHFLLTLKITFLDEKYTKISFVFTFEKISYNTLVFLYFITQHLKFFPSSDNSLDFSISVITPQMPLTHSIKDDIPFF